MSEGCKCGRNRSHPMVPKTIPCTYCSKCYICKQEIGNAKGVVSQSMQGTRRIALRHRTCEYTPCVYCGSKDVKQGNWEPQLNNAGFQIGIRHSNCGKQCPHCYIPYSDNHRYTDEKCIGKCLVCYEYYSKDRCRYNAPSYYCTHCSTTKCGICDEPISKTSVVERHDEYGIVHVNCNPIPCVICTLPIGLREKYVLSGKHLNIHKDCASLCPICNGCIQFVPETLKPVKWTPQTHFRYPQEIKDALFTMALVFNRIHLSRDLKQILYGYIANTYATDPAMTIWSGFNLLEVCTSVFYFVF